MLANPKTAQNLLVMTVRQNKTGASHSSMISHVWLLEDGSSSIYHMKLEFRQCPNSLMSLWGLTAQFQSWDKYPDEIAKVELRGQHERSVKSFGTSQWCSCGNYLHPATACLKLCFSSSTTFKTTHMWLICWLRSWSITALHSLLTSPSTDWCCTCATGWTMSASFYKQTCTSSVSKET